MRRIIILILCCVLLTGVVYADNRADTVRNSTTVLTDGSAKVTLTVNIVLDEAVTGLTFPVPRGAEDVSLNGTLVETAPSRDNASVELVDLSYLNGATGAQKLTFAYTLPAVVGYEDPEAEEEERKLQLQVPLLSGFSYPVDSMEFSVTLPADVADTPNFYSGYFLQSIESDLAYTFEDGVIEGVVLEPMKDKETLAMTMLVTQEQFPDLVIVEENENFHLYIMAALTAVALVFWLLFLRSLPIYGWRRNAPPVGIHAGEFGSRLTMEGGDLTMMIFQWAQLGYVRIVPDKRERVWLHKRMEMGNERSIFEVKCFNQLFGRNQSVEGTGSRYAKLWQSVGNTIDRKEEIVLGGLGAKGVFRFLAMLVSTAAGISMGGNILEEGGTWQPVLMAALGVVGSLTAWKIQAGVMKLHLRKREAVPGGIFCCLLWMGVSIFADRPLAGIFSTVVQILAGFFAAWGGRRTHAGRQIACHLMALRHYLAYARREELKEEMGKNPDYFFEMIPYAMAFGVENAFAGRFGRKIMPQCSYLEADRASKRTAREWAVLMRQTAEKLDGAGKKANTYRKR